MTSPPEYEARLFCGALMLWATPEGLAYCGRPLGTTPGGQLRYTDLTIEAILMLASVLRVPLQQAIGHLGSVPNRRG
jgi:hypothetical protein